MAKWHRFKPGVYQSVGWNWPLPEKLGATAPYALLWFRCGPSVAYGGGESTRLWMLSKVQNHEGDAADVAEHLAEISSADSIPAIVGSSTDGFATLYFCIPNSRIASRPAGGIEYSLQVSSLSTGPDFLISEPRFTLRYGPQPAGVVNGWNLELPT